MLLREFRSHFRGESGMRCVATVFRQLATVAQAAVIMVVVTAAALAAEGEPQEILLWPEGMPGPTLTVPAGTAETVTKGDDGISRRTNVSTPRLLVYRPSGESEGPRPAVIVAPGGGYSILADEHEGTDVCRWFNEHGYVAFLLHDRVPTRSQGPDRQNLGPVMDAQKAVHDVRLRAEEFGINPKKIALLGFSAGGQTAAVATAGAIEIETKEGVSVRPNATVLIYPWNLVEAKGEPLRPDMTISEATPPMFIAQAGNDRASIPQGATTLYLALVEVGVPAEVHIYQDGGHGFGMRPRDGAPVSRDWPKLALEWLHGLGF
jgi:acetyl esterase/lipase